MPPAAAHDSTRRALLEAARDLAQARGYNAFSFRDLSQRVGVTTASIHYHFPTKAHLGRELVVEYRQSLAEAMRQIEARVADPAERLRRLAGLLRQSIRKGTRMCLCGMFGAEFVTLPGPVQEEVRLLFSECESWIAGVLAAGRTDGSLRFNGRPDRAARSLFSGLQGAMMAACAFQDDARFTEAAAWLLDRLTLDPAR